MAFAAALLIAACGPSEEEKPGAAPDAAAAPAQSATTPAPAPAEQAATPAPSETAGETVASSTGTKLRFFRDVLESDQPQKPSFELLADRFAMTVDQTTGDTVYVVEKATAVAYGKDGTETRFEADGGTFNDTTKTTQLSGHVVCTTGTQRVEMQDVIWTNETMTAATQNPVVVSDGDTKLQAASMEYNTDTRALSLHRLSGAVSLAGSQAADAADVGPFQFIDITKGGLGEFVDGQLKHIDDGVAIALRPADPNAKPMQLEAKKIVFGWDAEQRTKPKSIALDGGVSVDGPQGLITASAADLNLAGNSIEFSGNVHGKSDSIESFEAERINYDMKSGDSEMIGLVARGIKLGAPGGEAKSGTTDFSSMNIERAGRVVSSGGQVKTMSGGVSISLTPSDAGAKSMKLNAGDATFAWSGEGGQPTAIAMRGSVRVDGPQGEIRAERADFDLAKKQLVFSGKVNGGLPQIERFDADKFTYNLESGEALMTDLTAKGLAISNPQEKKEPAEGDKKRTSYSKMDIVRAPEVSITGQQLNWMRGGVELTMHPDDPKDKPINVKSQEVRFSQGEGANAPQRVIMSGGVDVQAPEVSASSETADLDMQTNKLTFDGNVKVSTPELQNATARQFVYDLATGRPKFTGLKSDAIDVSKKEKDARP